MYSVTFEGLDGSGKTTLVDIVEQELKKNCAVRRQKLGPFVLSKFRAFANKKLGDSDRYQEIFDPGFRNRLYVTEGAVEESYRRASQIDEIVLRDRWIDTLRVYSGLIFDDPCGEIFAAQIDKSDLTFYLEVPALIALDRLTQAEDWLPRRIGRTETLRLLKRLAEQYSKIYSLRDDVIRLDAKLPPGKSQRKVLDTILTRCDCWQQSPLCRSRPASIKRIAIEGIDGAGKSTIVKELEAWIGGNCSSVSFAEASRKILKAAVGGGAKASSRLRKDLASSFRQQSYVIDALVQLTSELPGSRPIQIFDRWMPAFNRMRGEINQYVEFFDYLVESLPPPPPP